MDAATRCGERLFREQLADVAEGLELQCIAGGILEEHRGLLAHLPLEANARLDAKEQMVSFEEKRL